MKYAICKLYFGACISIISTKAAITQQLKCTRQIREKPERAYLSAQSSNSLKYPKLRNGYYAR